jgi:catechol 2,3-dioxygenase-like lactoylglutathione lyase family enzyme
LALGIEQRHSREGVFSHIFLGVSDFDRALAFYNPLMSILGINARFCERERPWAGWQSNPGTRPLFLIGAPHDQLAHEHGNGQMVAFDSESRAIVDRAYAAALANGGTSEGEPGLRPEYHDHYYGAYFRDPDGNKLCVVCHVPPGIVPAETSRGDE